MPQFNLNQNASLDAVSAAPSQISVTDNLVIVVQESVPAAQPASLTTRTDNTHGTLTMTNSGHGIITGQRIDIQWAAGQTYNVTVGTVSGTSVPITLSTGTLPAAATAITVGIPQQTLIAITGDNLSALLFVMPAATSGYVVMATSAPADENAQYIAAAGSYSWYTGSGITNPLAGVTIASVWISHFNVNAAQTPGVAALAH